MLAEGGTLPDFKVQHIPVPNQNPGVYRRLHELLLQRDRTEFSLNNMMDDKAEDGTDLDPYRNFEDDYEILSQLHDDVNRAMFRIYINYLEPAAGTSMLAMSVMNDNTETPCPYRHARDAPLPPVTQPLFDPIAQGPAAGALTAHRRRPNLEHQQRTVWAIADTGASHVLIRDSDSWVLSDVRRRSEHDPPYAAMNAANGGLLSAVGRGQMTIGGLPLVAFIFRDQDLVSNLLGLSPFANHGCESTFKAKSFQIYRPHTRTVIVHGTRSAPNTLWDVDISAAVLASTPATDGIPPPAKGQQGIFIEANHVKQYDNRTYVRYVHASLGYPAPSTFLRAVINGYITGPTQFPRLSAKMVRKHLPNAVPTAKGHLDRTPAAQPHPDSDAVSGQKRYHTRSSRSSAIKSETKTNREPFSHANIVKSTTLHLDYTGALPEVHIWHKIFPSECLGRVHQPPTPCKLAR
jgi:hypothetical protein